MRHRIHRTYRFLHPNALHLAVLEEHLHQRRLRIVLRQKGAVGIVYHVVYGNGIVLGMCLSDFTFGKEGQHFLRRELIKVYGVEHLLDGKGLPDDMRPVDGGIFHVGTYLLAQQLLITIPDNGVTVHRHAGILLVIDQRVAHGL